MKNTNKTLLDVTTYVIKQAKIYSWYDTKSTYLAYIDEIKRIESTLCDPPNFILDFYENENFTHLHHISVNPLFEACKELKLKLKNAIAKLNVP